MKLLSSLCVCHGVAMRDKQRLIYKHLLNCSELLVQTSQHPKVHRSVSRVVAVEPPTKTQGRKDWSQACPLLRGSTGDIAKEITEVSKLFH